MRSSVSLRNERANAGCRTRPREPTDSVWAHEARPTEPWAPSGLISEPAHELRGCFTSLSAGSGWFRAWGAKGQGERTCRRDAEDGGGAKRRERDGDTCDRRHETITSEIRTTDAETRPRGCFTALSLGSRVRARHALLREARLWGSECAGFQSPGPRRTDIRPMAEVRAEQKG